MESRVDEPDAEGPQDAPELPFGAPAHNPEVDFSGSLDKIFGHAPAHADEAAPPVTSHDKLAELFGRPSAAEPDSRIHWTPPHQEAPEAGADPSDAPTGSASGLADASTGSATECGISR